MSTFGKEQKHGVKSLRTSMKTVLLLIEKGYVPTYPEIIEAYSVSRATAYRYRPELEAVFDELMDVIDRRVEREVAELLREKHIKAARERHAGKQVPLKLETEVSPQ